MRQHSMWARASVLVTATATLVAMLTGCGTVPAGAASGTLSVWVRAAGDSQEAYQAIFQAFGQNPGARVKMFSTLTDFETKLDAAAAAHTLPDVIIDDAAELGTFRSQGIIEPIDRNQIAGQADLTEKAWDSVKDMTGAYYGVPFSAQADLLFIRSDWLDKVGMQPPTTWDQMVQLAKAFTTQDPDGDGKNDTYGLAVPGSAQRGYLSWNWSTYLWQAGGDYFVSKGPKAFTAAVNSPQAVRAARWYEDLFCTSKVVQPSALKDTTVEANRAFFSGVAGMYLTGPYAFGTADKADLKGKYVVVPAPRGPAGGDVLAEGTTIYLTAGSKQADTAKRLAAFMISPEAQEIGMAALSTSTIVRLPVNKQVDAATVYRNDPRWRTEEQVFQSSAHYEADAMPNWQAYRQATSDALNALISSCRDPQSTMDALNAELDNLLKQEGLLTGG